MKSSDYMRLVDIKSGKIRPQISDRTRLNNIRSYHIGLDENRCGKINNIG